MSRVLQYLSYPEYLNSDRWRETRAAALKRADGKCAICGKAMPIMNVHHRNYDRIGEEEPEDLVCLCELDHQFLELGREVAEGIK